MVDILPFKGLHYNPSRIKDFSRVLAPPYDIISDNQREKLLKQDPYNIVNLTLPAASEENTKYENARKHLDKWIDNKVLVHDDKKCFYILEEEFIEDGTKKNFYGFIGLLKVEEYTAGKVLRHEKTLPKPKEDRLNLLTATRTNLEFIYTLYNDEDNSISSILDDYTVKSPMVSTPVEYDPDLFFRIWKIDERIGLNKITGLMEARSLLIADGHHRYETSRLYKEIQQKDLMPQDPENYIMALFVSSTQKNILIHPTHRVVKFKNPFLPVKMIEILKQYFYVDKLNDPTDSRIRREMQEAASSNIKRLCLFFSKNDCYMITLKNSLIDIYKETGEGTFVFDEDFDCLDVNILHRLILQSILKNYIIEDVIFVHTVSEVIDNINKEECPAAGSASHAGFILNPPTIDTVERLSNVGKIMPQKSTYFYPKPCSGLIMYGFDIR